jgi:hypothetical protein
METNQTTNGLTAGKATVELNMENIAEQDLQEFIARQIRIWNNPAQAARLTAMDEVYLDNVIFFDHEGTVTGKTGLNERITKLQQKFEGFKFSLHKVDNSYNVVRYYWNFGPEANPELISGMDLIILEQGKILSLNVFVDHLPA